MKLEKRGDYYSIEGMDENDLKSLRDMITGAWLGERRRWYEIQKSIKEII